MATNAYCEFDLARGYSVLDADLDNCPRDYDWCLKTGEAAGAENGSVAA